MSKIKHIKYSNLVLEKRYILEQLKNSGQSTTFRDNMRKTVGDSTASFPDAEKVKDTTMWLNMWAKQFVSEFSKNEISKVVPPGSQSYCSKPNFIYPYESESDIRFGGNKNMINNLNEKNNVLFACIPQEDLLKKPYSHEFIVNNQKMGWFQLVQSQWGVTNAQTIQSSWNQKINFVKTNNGKYCSNLNQFKCSKAVYVDPLSWFKDPKNVILVLDVMSIGSAFIPLVGPALSALFGLGSAGLSLATGDKKTATITAFISMLPGLGVIGGRIAAKIGSAGLTELSRKLIQNGLTNVDNITNETLETISGKFTKQEIEILRDIVSNKESLKTSSNVVSQNPKELEKTLSKFYNLEDKQVINRVTQTMTDTGGSLTAEPGYEKIKKIKNDYIIPDYAKDIFGAFSDEDYKKLKDAWKEGWRPGNVVPEKYQTNHYKEKFQEEEQGTLELKKLLASLKNN